MLCCDLILSYVVSEEKSITEEPVVPEKPEVVVFAMFGSTAKYPMNVSTLGEMVRSFFTFNTTVPLTVGLRQQQSQLLYLFISLYVS